MAVPLLLSTETAPAVPGAVAGCMAYV